MRALAEFIMRGRIQAALVAFLGNLLPLISPAAVSLVTLSRGLTEGALLSLWALLPLLIAFYVSDINAVVTLASIAGVIGVVASSGVLRVTASWSRTLVFVVVFSGLAALVLDILFVEQIGAFELVIADLFRQIQQPSESTFIPGRNFLLGVIGYMVALTSVLCLVLGRWWQAMLYNPGGFKSEFHQLRFGAGMAIIFLAGMVICDVAAQEYASWSGLLGLPLVFAGIALVHYTVAFYRLGKHWLVIFYVGLFVLSPLSLVLIGLAFLDSIMNIRSRLVNRSNNGD
jgi:hypothetical protein